MKRLFLILLFFLVIKGQGQTPSLHLGAKWFFSHPVTEGNFNKIGYIKYAYLKDSLIAGKAVQTISITKHQSNELIEYYSNLYIYQTGDSTLLFNPHTNQFNLLYNFGAKNGDTITVFDRKTRVPDFFIGFDSIAHFKYIILKTDTVDINGQQFRRQFYKNDLESDWRLGENTIDEIDTNEFILEKIGGSRYFLGYSVNVTVGQNQPLLRCYADSITDYKNPSRKSDCDYFHLPTGIEEVSPITPYNISYTLYNGLIEFNNLDGNYDLNIYSSTGNIVLKQQISTPNNKLSIDKLQQGLNLITITHPTKKSMSFKILKL